jgi:hypothetical protein
MPETNDHLLTECNFSEAIWDKIADRYQLHPSLKPFRKGDVKSWLQILSSSGSKRQQNEYAGIIFFVWWFIWKEHNQRIFEQQESSFLQVVERINEALLVFQRANAAAS